MPCDPSVAELILSFSIGGIGLRALIALLKKQLKVKGFLALLLTFACCASAVAIYMAITGWVWMCFLLYACLVFVGTQIAYQATKK